MSGQPNKYSTSAATYRQQYMDALGLRASLDDQVLQAVKVYKQTGQVPAISSMPDNRTASEKLADIQGLKIKLIAELKPIISVPGAQAVIQGVERSPYNGDGSLFSFLAQRINSIVKLLKDAYGVGIKGDANDIETFVKYIEDFYAKNKESLSTTKSYFDTAKSGSILQPVDLDRLLADIRSLLPKIIAKINTSGIREPAIIQEIQKFAKYVTDMRDVLSSANLQIVNAQALLVNGNDMIGANTVGRDVILEFVKTFKDFQDKLPSPTRVFAIIKQIYTALPNIINLPPGLIAPGDLPKYQSDTDLVSQLIVNLLSIFPPVEEYQALHNAHQAFVALAPPVPGGGGPPPGGGGPPPGGGRPPPGGGGPPPGGGGPPGGGTFGGFGGTFGGVGGAPMGRLAIGGPPGGFGGTASMVLHPSTSIDASESEYDSRTGADAVRLRKFWDRVNKDIIHSNVSDYIKHHLATQYTNDLTRMQIGINPDNEERKDSILSVLNHYIRPSGSGIVRRRGRPKGSGIKIPFSEKVDSSQGIQASPRYISFGKHVINKKKLGDGILSIRTKSGANIASSPVKHISQNMKIVVDKIIGGAIPSYEELSRLTEEEKAYLHKVSKQADILDKFSIPAPSKDQEEKEIHEYEVMRGEIMSGNDNKELIKKFKLLIIKLSRRGALPKKEVTDILSELVELGY